MAFTAITNNMDWAAVSFINEFDGAIDERSQAIGGSSRSNTAAGTDVQAASFWTTIQSWISSNAGSFVQSHTSSGGNITDYDGETSIPIWTFANLMKSVSLGVAGAGERSFRRATTIPTTWGDWDDAAYSYGIMQAGDIIGPWIFKDLLEAFKRLIWTRKSYSYSEQSTDCMHMGSDSDSSYSAAKAGAAANWFNLSRRYTNTAYAYSHTMEMSPGSMSAIAERNHTLNGGISIPAGAASITRDIDWYAYVESYGATFSAHGDGLTEDRYNLISTDAADTGSGSRGDGDRWLSSRWGSMPNWPPSDPGNCGYQVGDCRAIIRWNVTGGFDYV